jgi:hypothetical protein
MSKAPKKTGSESMREAVKSLKRTVADTIASEEPKGDARGMRRQTLYLPPVVHEQLRLLAFQRKLSQQELFRQGLNLLFAREGLPSWEDLEDKGREGQ